MEGAKFAVPFLNILVVITSQAAPREQTFSHNPFRTIKMQKQQTFLVINNHAIDLIHTADVKHKCYKFTQSVAELSAVLNVYCNEEDLSMSVLNLEMLNIFLALLFLVLFFILCCI